MSHQQKILAGVKDAQLQLENLLVYMQLNTPKDTNGIWRPKQALANINTLATAKEIKERKSNVE